MNRLKHTLYICLLLLIPMSCEKPYAAENDDEPVKNEATGSPNGEQQGGKNEDDTTTGGSGEDEDGGYEETDIVDGDGDTSYRKRVYTVAEFIAAQLGQRAVRMEGYIVGACAKNIGYAEWSAPFTHDQAILLADRPGERDGRKVVAVRLKEGDMRTQLSLAKHPENAGRKVYVYGVKQSYLGVAGMSSVITGYGWAD